LPAMQSGFVSLMREAFTFTGMLMGEP